jgi:hypothetical protein
VRVDEKIDPELELEQANEQLAALEQQRASEEEVDEVETSAFHFHELASFIEGLLRGETRRDVLERAATHERAALELLATALLGRDTLSDRTVLAEDRLEMLNQALAVLQPALAAGFEDATFESRDLYRSLVDEVSELKHSLQSLTDAQEEMFLEAHLRETAAAGKPQPKPPDAGEVGDERPSKLAGPGPAVEMPVAPSTLSGPGPAVEKPAVPTSLTGPGEVPDKKPQPSTAWDGDEPRGR